MRTTSLPSSRLLEWLPQLTFVGLLFVLLEPCVQADDRERLVKLFQAAKPGETVIVPPGDYELDGSAAIPLRSGLRVSAYGAKFRLPAALGDRARVVLFEGTDLTDFEWLGGSFHGNVFDPTRDATWEPNANTRCILINTSAAAVPGIFAFVTFAPMASLVQ